MMIPDDRTADVLARLDAMRVQEATLRRRDYLRHGRDSSAAVTASDRAALVSWVRQIASSLQLSPDAVWAAFDHFDRYMASGKGRSRAILQDRGQFQLAAVTAFYTAVKISEPVVLGLDTLSAVCHGKYREAEFEAMERDMLHALGWRVAVHTPMDVVRHTLQALRVDANVEDGLLHACQEYVNSSISDLRLSCCPPSVLGVVCLASALAESDAPLSSSKKRALWDRIREVCPFDSASNEVAEAQERLLALEAPRKARVAATAPTSRQFRRSASNGTSSPRCVSQAARQA